MFKRFVEIFAVALSFFFVGSALAALPPEGVPEIHRRGAVLDIRTGVSTAIGGRTLNAGSFRPSAPSLFFRVAGGYEFTSRFEVGAGFSLAAVGNRCLGQVSDKGVCMESATDWRSVSSDFTVATLSAFAAWKQPVTQKLRIVGSLSFGWVFLTPEPRFDLAGSFDVGAGVGILWETPLDHFFIGVDFGWNFAVQAALHRLSLSPWVRYVF